MSTGLHCLLVGGTDYWQSTIVKCGRPGMAGSATEAQSHDKGRGRRSVAGVHGSITEVQNKSLTRDMKNNERGQKCNGGKAS